MGIIQRIGVWLAGEPAVKATQGYGAGSWSQLWLSGNEGQVTPMTYPNSQAGWRMAVAMPWAGNCVAARANAVAQAPLKLYRRKATTSEQDAEDSDAEVADHPVLDLLRDPNPVVLGGASFMQAWERQLSIYGECVVAKIRGTGEARQLHVMPVEAMDMQRNADGYIVAYRHRATDRIYEAEDVIRHYYQCDEDPFLARSPTASAVAAINRYMLADQSQQAIDQRGGQGGGVITTDFNALDVDVERFKSEWDSVRSDPRNAGRDAFLPPGTDYKNGVLTAQQMQREERAMRLKKEIFAAYSVPPAMAGDYSDASVLANADQQARNFWQLWVVPECDGIAAALNRQLLWAEWPDTKKKGLYLAHDFSDIYALQPDEGQVATTQNIKTTYAVALYGGKLTSRNEARTMVGLDPLDDPAADEIDAPAPEIAQPGGPQPEALPADQESKTEDAAIETDVDPQDKTKEPGKAATKAGAPVEHTGAMIALMLPRAVADRIALDPSTLPPGSEGTPADEMHITLVYLGEAATFSSDDRWRIEMAVQDVTRRTKLPINVTIKGGGWFSGDGDMVPLWAGVAAEGLVGFRADIARSLSDLGVALPESHGDWRPHVTLAYVPAGKRATLPSVPEIRTAITGVTVVWADQQTFLPLSLDFFGQAQPRIHEISAKASVMPIVDYVGMTALDTAGNPLGEIEKIHRFGVHDGIEATKAAPVVIVAGRAYRAGDVAVAVKVNENHDELGRFASGPGGGSNRASVALSANTTAFSNMDAVEARARDPETGWEAYRADVMDLLDRHGLKDDLENTYGLWGTPEWSYNLHVKMDSDPDFERKLFAFCDEWGATYKQESVLAMIPKRGSVGRVVAWEFESALANNTLDTVLGELTQLQSASETYLGATVSADKRRFSYWASNSDDSHAIQKVMRVALEKAGVQPPPTTIEHDFDWQMRSAGSNYVTDTSAGRSETKPKVTRKGA